MAVRDFGTHLAMAEEGDVAAQIYVGWAYFYGKLVARDQKAGEGWLRKAYEQGSLEGGYRLALVLLQQRDPESIGLLTRLGDQGYSPANYELGRCLYAGDLIDRDPQQAAMRWAIAANNGHELSKMMLLKHKRSIAPFLQRPLLTMKIFASLLRAVWLFIKDDQDVRVLGRFS